MHPYVCSSNLNLARYAHVHTNVHLGMQEHRINNEKTSSKECHSASVTQSKTPEIWPEYRTADRIYKAGINISHTNTGQAGNKAG
jgi:hypothetical protein